MPSTAGTTPVPAAGAAAGSAEGLRLQVLGPLTAWREGMRVGLGEPQQRAVLGLLALHPNVGLTADALVDAVWGEAAPATARQLVQSYISRLRRLLDPGRPPRDPAGLLVSAGSSYRLQVSAGQVDLLAYRQLVAQARAARAAGDDAGACADFERALGLWQGEPLGDIPGLGQHPAVVGLAHDRSAVIGGYAEAAFDAGLPEQVLPHLQALADREPLNENAGAKLMIALASTGQQAAALQVYDDIRGRLDQQLGVGPGQELTDAHLRVLRHQVAPAPVPPVRPPIVPAQLPADVYGFAGRHDHLGRLDAVLAGAAAEASTAVVISAVCGTPGVGKTALAVHWAHRVRDAFPDGQLYVNLRGFDPGGQVMAPAAAVRGFLDALQVPPQRIPAGLDAQAALYRSLLAGRRVLVVLDNARDAEQARPLLPGTPTALVVVTSRNQLTSLVAVDGAHPLTLDLLTDDEARQLLARRLGADRIAAEPQAVEQVIGCCARLPLALTIAAARAEQSGFPLTTLAGELADASGRLDTLDAGDPAGQVRTVFSWSYTALSPAAARLFRLLGLQPGPDISAAAAASLAGLPPVEVRRLLGELSRASLLTEHSPGRYGFHDLLRAYAAELTHTHDPEDQRRAAVGRMLDHYLHTAHTADRLLNPARDPIPLPLTPPSPRVTPEQPAEHAQALAWLTAEHPVLRAAIRRAAAAGYDTHAWQLAWTLDTFLNRRGHWHELTTAWQTALTSAGRLGNPAAQAHAHRLLAWPHTRLGRYPDAHTHLRHALDLYAQAGDFAGQAHTHHNLGSLWDRQGRPERALRHAQQALTLYQAAGHRRGQANALSAVGWCHALLGNHQQALTYCQQALTVHQELGDRAGQAHTWDSLGYTHNDLGHHSEAADCYQHALHLFRDLGDRYQEATILTHLGDSQHAAGDAEAARSAWQQALDILGDLEHADADAVRAKLQDLDSDRS